MYCLTTLINGKRNPKDNLYGYFIVWRFLKVLKQKQRNNGEQYLVVTLSRHTAHCWNELYFEMQLKKYTPGRYPNCSYYFQTNSELRSFYLSADIKCPIMFPF